MDFLEALFTLLPLPAFFESLGLDKAASGVWANITVLFLAFAVPVVLTVLGKLLAERLKTVKTAKSLNPYFDFLTVKRARKLFIPTRAQNHSPTREDEPLFTHQFVFKNHLIPFFIKTAFNEKKESDKFYLVLADSGMGKTTFMINLYVQYTSVFNFRKKYKMKLFPFGDPGIWDEIKKIDMEEAKKTILLLDAFDEDKQFISQETPGGLTHDECFRKRMDEIIDTVRHFKEVVMTSRTQYFPGQEDTPYELKIRRFGADEFHTLAKLYLSPFTEKEIRQYLRKKYGLFRFWNRKKKKTARHIVRTSPKLMIRPMLLSYIDYLADGKNTFTTTYEIYETLINKWIEREAHKRKHKTTEREKFKGDLCEYSRFVALEIYKQWEKTKKLSLEEESAIKIARDHTIDLTDYEITGQSLLTRDAARNWKFAHKSIYEFLLAKETVVNSEFWCTCNFIGMDMAARFFSEKAPGMPLPGSFVFIKGGTFLMGSPGDEPGREAHETEHEVTVSDFYLAKYTVTVAEFENFVRESNYKTDADRDGGSYIGEVKKAGVNWRCDVKGNIQTDKHHPVIYVSWNDAIAYCTWLSKKTNINFHLPSEAEWEYACRAGSTTPFHTGANITTDQANYDGNYPYNNNPKGVYIGTTTPVGSYSPNAWGLYDMHGNVWEWCSDWYGKMYYEECKDKKNVVDPRGPDTGDYCVLRGGCWNHYVQYVRSASRYYAMPGYCQWDYGLRLARGHKRQE